MNFIDFIARLEEELRRPLPGRAVQLTMSSIKRIRELLDFSGQNQAVQSSVLVLLYPGLTDQSIHLVVMLRPTYDGIHSGQISLPGGKFEHTDRDLAATALRETQEEIGVDPVQVTIIGKLSELYIPPSNYLVQPYVGYTKASPQFVPHPKEVEKIIEVDLTDLMDDRNIKRKHILIRNGMNILAPCYIINGYTIWGATAMMLSEFREVVKRTGL